MKNYFFALIAFSFIGVSCSGPKDLTQSRINKDSLRVVKLEQENETFESTIAEYQRQIKELEQGYVGFSIDCDTAFIERAIKYCPPEFVDSLRKMLNQQRSTIKMMADGTTVLEGRISWYRFLIDKTTTEKSSLQHLVDSFKKINFIDTTHLTVDSKEKIKHKAGSSFGSIIAIIFTGLFCLAIGFIIGRKTTLVKI